jgi:hypothetical protein
MGSYVLLCPFILFGLMASSIYRGEGHPPMLEIYYYWVF